MELLVDLFGYLSIVCHGATLAAQSAALGGAMFLVFLARPRAWLLGEAGARITARVARLSAIAALLAALAEAASIAMPGLVLSSTLEMPLAQALGAQFALAGNPDILGRSDVSAQRLAFGVGEGNGATAWARARLHRIQRLLEALVGVLDAVRCLRQGAAHSFKGAGAA